MTISNLGKWILRAVIAVSFVWFLAWFLSGCYTQKKAEKAIAKANYKYPVVVAKKTRELYPCTTTKIERTTDSAAYNLWKDSVGKTADFYKALLASIEPEIITVTDTVSDERKIAKLKEDNDKLKGVIRQLNYALSNVPPIYIKEKEKVEDSAKILLITSEMAEQKSRFDKSMSDSSALISKQRLLISELERKNSVKKWWIIGLGIGLLLLIAALVYIIRQR